jgi:hypothetical protein
MAEASARLAASAMRTEEQLSSLAFDMKRLGHVFLKNKHEDSQSSRSGNRVLLIWQNGGISIAPGANGR